MNNITTWDIETKGLGGDFVIGGTYNGTDYKEFTTWGDFFNIIKTNPDKTVFYAHNAAKYDNRYLLYEAFKRSYKVKNILYIQGGFVFKIKINNKTYDFRDSIFLTPGKLKDLCKDFKISQSKKEFDINEWAKNGYPITPEVKEYLKYDCISLYELLEKFYSEFNVNDVKLTIASTAFNILLKDEKKRKALANYISKEDEIEIRKAYKGGRCEVYKRKGENLFKYDVNSMYPFVMRNFLYPAGDMFRAINKREIDICINKFKNIGIVKANIKAPYNHIPYLVKKDETLNKLIAPIGTWADYITTFEYLEALKRGYEIDIIEAYLYKKKENHFKSYVDNYYNIKKTSTGAKKQIAKLMLNSVYGKFAQKRTNDKIVTLPYIIEKGLRISNFVPLGSKMYTKEETYYYDRRINPIQSIFVTAYARHILYEGIENIINQGGEVYYADTDAIITDIKLDNNKVSDTELGKWALETQIEKYIGIDAKLYICDDKVKAKGIPSTEQQKLKYGDFQNMLIGKGKTFKFPSTIGAKEQFKRVNHNTTNYICEIEKTKTLLSSNFNKRALCNDGITTRPIELKQKL
jgi:hypothetical protein